MNHLGKISIRMKLDDFTNEKVEKEILQELENIQKISNGIVELLLWFDDKKDNSFDLGKILESMEEAHHWKTSIKAVSKMKSSDYVWFDVRCVEDLNVLNGNFRFQYRYHEPSQIATGLSKFSEAIRFFKDKPPKEKKVERKQKRNDL
ncbi:hypothetical protein CMO86_05295 [Candidatus Woesearchaeota archaeon]|nr:hypothetical protein [Candidatus Woesearchaeota archaeon]|tara:strand:- start:755 stop:1198 length:444 start_codon:yes stop_codon:yes gene_type:complete